MNSHTGPACTFAPARIRDLTKEGDHAQFLHKRGVEGNFVEAIEYFRRGARRVSALARIDLHQYRVVGVALSHQRCDGRIADIAPVPEKFTVYFNGLKHRRQTGRCQEDVWSDLRIAKNTPAAGADAGGGNEQPHRGAREAFEVYAFRENGTQRIVAERIEIVG